MMEFGCSIPDSSSRAKAQVLLVPYPAQGHVTPFMKLAHRLADCGVKVTFVITEFIYERMLGTMQSPSVSSSIHPKNMYALQDIGTEEKQHQVRIVPVPDGLKPEEDRKDDIKLSESIARVMPGYLEDFIKEERQLESEEKTTCFIVDVACGWALDVALKLGLKRAIFFTTAPGILAMILQIPKLIESGIINTDGSTRKNEKIELSPNLPALSPAELMWNRAGNEILQKQVFEFLLPFNQIVAASNWLLCNWFQELDPAANALSSNILPVGPVLANGLPSGNIWSEDQTCLSWLDRQPSGSVIYAAFGSSSVFSQRQFSELALGLQLVRRPFLWVVRPDFIDGTSINYPDGFLGKVANFGKIVQWAPQEKVLAHPSVACYLTHCGWNSIMEGISMGVPFLCWPYFADQFYNKSCICDGWKIGLWLNPDENGMVNRQEIKSKSEELLSSVAIIENALKLKGLAQKSGRQGGSSSNNLEHFVKQIRG